jgi:glycosyltransferase involved in cell wall biosynthesis
MLSYANGRKGIDAWRVLQNKEWLDCVCSEGHMTPEQVKDEYLKADAIVSTALVEGGPMACYEALSMGKPYYGRRHVGVHNETNGVIIYDTDTQLCDMLNAQYLIKKQRADAVEQISWAQWAADWWSVIDSPIRKRIVETNIVQIEDAVPVARHTRRKVRPYVRG